MLTTTRANVGVLACVNAFGGLVFGYNVGVINGANSGKNTAITTIDSAWEKGLFSCAMLFGAFASSTFAGPLAGKIGRRFTIMLAAIIAILFSVLCGLCNENNLTELYLARGFFGLSVGLAAVVCPMYVGEMAPEERKGTLGTVFQLAITIGIFIAYCIAAGLNEMHYSSKAWRYPFFIAALPGVGLLLTSFVMPESHVFHKGNLRVNAEETPLLNRPYDIPFGEKMGMFLQSRALWIGLTLAMAQQLTGINAFMYFAGDIFKAAGLNPSAVGYATIALGGWNFLATFIATFLIDRLGRRPLLIVSTIIMTICCVLLGFVTLMHHHDQLKGVLSIALLLIFVAAFESGDGPLFWIVASELFTPEIKAIGASTLNAFQWLFNILLGLTFSILVAKIGEASVFFIFGGFGLFCALVMIFFLPETRPQNQVFVVPAKVV